MKVKKKILKKYLQKLTLWWYKCIILTFGALAMKINKFSNQFISPVLCINSL